MIYERDTDIEDSSDALILSALTATESALSHELGMCLLRRRHTREDAA